MKREAEILTKIFFERKKQELFKIFSIFNGSREMFETVESFCECSEPNDVIFKYSSELNTLSFNKVIRVFARNFAYVMQKACVILILHMTQRD